MYSTECMGGPVGGEDERDMCGYVQWGWAGLLMRNGRAVGGGLSCLHVSGQRKHTRHGLIHPESIVPSPFTTSTDDVSSHGPSGVAGRWGGGGADEVGG